MKYQRTISLIVIGALLWVGSLACRSTATQTAPVVANPQTPAPAVKLRTHIGFRTRRHLEEHYQKHGREFGSISQDEYLLQAQTLRDRAAGGDILEVVRDDGVTTRFDRQAGTFVAFNEDFTIRTYFKPNDGERYFNRQLKRKQ
jgi:pyocin large subunit-like protein